MGGTERPDEAQRDHNGGQQPACGPENNGFAPLQESAGKQPKMLRHGMIGTQKQLRFLSGQRLFPQRLTGFCQLFFKGCLEQSFLIFCNG